MDGEENKVAKNGSVDKSADAAPNAVTKTAEVTDSAAQKAAPVARDLARGAVDLGGRGLDALHRAGETAGRKGDAPEADAAQKLVGGAGKVVAKGAEITRDVAHAAAPVVKDVAKGLGGLAKKGLDKAKKPGKKKD